MSMDLLAKTVAAFADLEPMARSVKWNNNPMIVSIKCYLFCICVINRTKTHVY